MPLVTALLSLLSRKMGSIIQAVFGWSVTGLFGRQSAPKQTALSIAMLLALAWPLLVVGVVAPKVAAWAIAFVPLHDWMGETALRVLWLVLALAAPLVVGAITRWVAPDRKLKGGPVRTLLGGYPITLGFALSFLITLVTVPLLKLGALRRGWKDEHVYVQVREGRYAALVQELADACRRARVEVVADELPWAMSAATRVIKWFARGSLDAIVADRPKMLRGDELEAFVYPGDLLLRGKKSAVTRVRAAVLRVLPLDAAHLCRDPRAQELEDQILRMWDVVARHDGPSELGRMARSRLKEITRDLEHADVPYEDWVLLYTHLQRLERAVCGGPTVVDDVPVQHAIAVAKTHVDDTTVPVDEDAAALVAAALAEARELARLEVAMAREEAKEQIAGAKRGAIIGGAGLGALLVALVLAAFSAVAAAGARPLLALAVGGGSLLAAAICAVIAVKLVPADVLGRARRRISTDLHELAQVPHTRSAER